MDPARVLLLCSGNYYRSRFAELLFNHHAASLGVQVVADSAGLLEQCHTLNSGLLSPHAIAGLSERHIPVPAVTRVPRDVTEADLERASLVIALNEPEHRPIVERRFPEQSARVQYWDIKDVYEQEPALTLRDIEWKVRTLLRRLAG